MATIISPKHTQEQFKDGMALDDKIEVFIESVNGWQISTAKEMIQKGSVDWDFGILKVVTSYFEMIAKYRDGYEEERNSEHYFKEGLKQVFPEIQNWSDHAKTIFLDWVYSKVRCGLYHAGMTLSDIGISRDFDFPFQLVTIETQYDDGRLERRYQVNINVVRLVAAIENDFKKYAGELRDPSNAAVRENFQKKFDFDRKLSPAVEIHSP